MVKPACSNIYSNVSSESHCSFLEDVTIMFINKTDPKDPNRREHYWRHALKTMAPLGLNVEEDQVVSAIFRILCYVRS